MKKIISISIILFVAINIYAQQNFTTKNYKITKVPAKLKLDKYYKKYVDVNGIPIISSHKAPDKAIIAACRIVDFMTSSLPQEVLQAMIKNNARLAVMWRYEGVTELPEHAFLAKDTTMNWDLRARGLGGEIGNPLSSCAEENLLGYQIDKYHAEDILIHEFTHAIHGLGISPVNPNFNDELKEALKAAKAKGKYKNVYAATDYLEYFAEGVQSWFNVNAEMKYPDGKHNWVNTRKDLKKYDPRLFEIISRYFTRDERIPSCHVCKKNKYKRDR